jgi:hypothetical protein
LNSQIQFAYEKLLRVRGSPPQPVGWRLAFGQHGCIWSGFAILMFSLSSLALVGAASTGAGFFLGAAAVPALAGLACVYAGKVFYPPPGTPERAVRNVLEFISRGNFRGAWEMLAPTEREAGAGLFSDFEAFRQYWREVRRALGLRSGKLFYEEIAVETLAPDVAICRVLLEIAPQQLFLPTASGFASTPLGDQRSYFVQKMVVRCGNEWLIWSPALFGDDEADHSWLSTAHPS